MPDASGEGEGDLVTVADPDPAPREVHHHPKVLDALTEECTKVRPALAEWVLQAGMTTA
jgi:hypothetical protein